MVGVTLRYFAGPDVASYVRFTVGYTWLCSLSVIILVQLTSGRAVVPILQGFEDAGDFTVQERLKSNAHVNLFYYLCVGSMALWGVTMLVKLGNN